MGAEAKYRREEIDAIVAGLESIATCPQLEDDLEAVLTAIRVGDTTAYWAASTDLQVDPRVVAAELSARRESIEWVPPILRHCPTVARGADAVDPARRKALLGAFASSAAGRNERAAMRYRVRTEGGDPKSLPPRAGLAIAIAMTEPVVATDPGGSVYSLCDKWVNTESAAELVDLMRAAHGLADFRLVMDVDNELVDATALRLLCAPSREVMIWYGE